MRGRRGLSAEEAALWARVAQTVTPLPGHRAQAAHHHPKQVAPTPSAVPPMPLPKAVGRVPGPPAPPPPRAAKPRPLDRTTLDASWDRKLARGVVIPDFTLDLHGHTLEAAHARLDHGVAQAVAQGARVVLLITGRPRHHDDHSTRGDRRGAIRAKFLDWLAAGSHASRIAAIRPAHPRHGGAGAVYIVLRKPG